MKTIVKGTKIIILILFLACIYLLIISGMSNDFIGIGKVADLLVLKFAIFSLIPIIAPLCIGFMMKRIQKATNEERKNMKVMHKAKQEEYYEQHVKEHYVETKLLFQNLMKDKMLKRKGILAFKSTLNTCLGSHLKSYTKFEYKNDAHEIYIKLKNTSLTVSDHQTLQQKLEQLAITD